MKLNPGSRLFIDRRALPQAQLGPDPDAPAARPLEAGQARLRVERFALSANNITYAAFGEAMQYWQFFPSGRDGMGCLPVWGFATVVESRVEGIDTGRRVWGCLPAGTHLVVAPVKVSGAGFVDGAAHRRGLAAVYNAYGFCDADPGWSADGEALQALLRPLFMTAFLLDDFLAHNRFFGARRLLLSSASSKTAMATAHCLAQRRGNPDGARVVGLTAAAHLDFARGLGCYDEVLTYGDVDALPAELPSVYVDFAGSAALRRRIHQRLGDALCFSSSIGGTHWEALGSGRDLPGPRPTLFFAPARVAERSAPPPDGWGGAELQRRLAQAWTGFQRQVLDGAWLRVVEQRGPQAVLQTYGELLGGRIDTRLGLMLSLQD